VSKGSAGTAKIHCLTEHVGNWNTPIDRPAGHDVTSAFDMNPIGAGSMPLTHFGTLPPPPNQDNSLYLWTDGTESNPCHSIMPTSTLADCIPWNIPSPLRFGSDIQNIPPNLHQAVSHLSCTTRRNDSRRCSVIPLLTSVGGL